MQAIVQKVQNPLNATLFNQPLFAMAGDQFWTLLLMSCLMLSTLIVLPRLM
jgi:hypothetical protein